MNKKLQKTRLLALLPEKASGESWWHSVRKVLIASLVTFISLAVSGQDLARVGNEGKTQESGTATNGKRSLISLLDELQTKYDVNFIFSPKILANEYVNTNIKSNPDLEVTLKEVLKNSGLKYKKLEEGTYVISNQKESPVQKLEKRRTLNVKDDFSFSDQGPSAQINRVKSITKLMERKDVVIKGKVTSSEDGAPLPGVNILVKGTTSGSTTDINGDYSLNAGSTNVTLVFSFIGYSTQEVALNGRSVVDVSMAPDVEQLSEVVVIGYGTIKKSDLTGSVSSISAEEIKKVAITSLDQGIQGRAAGVQVTQNSSAPGGGVSIRVRGGNSLRSGNEPLYVVDGYPISGGGSPGGAGRSSLGGNPLSMLNPNDIQSIEILKDASSTAIYGSRGANGVVLITTKRGAAGKTNIDYEAYYGSQSILKKMDLMNGREYAELVNEANRNEGREEVFVSGNPSFPAPSEIGEGTNWQDAILRTAPVQSHQITLSGGTEHTQFVISGNYFDQTGIVYGSDFKRGSLRANIDNKVSERVKVGTNLAYSRIFANIGQSEGDGGGSSGAVNGAILMPPTIPIFQSEGVYTLQNNVPGGTTIGNPIATAKLTKDEEDRGRFLGNAFVDIKILDGLSFRTSFGTDLSNGERKIYHPLQTLVGSNAKGLAAQNSNMTSSYLNENILTYIKDINGIHSLNVVAGYTRQMQVSSGRGVEIVGFGNDILGADELDAGATPRTPTSYKNKWTLASYLGRINYSLKNKYLLTLTGRADGSSRFGGNNKWAFFPSIGAGWNISEENFMNGVGFFSQLKLRGSYGITGNQEIPLYSSISKLSNQNYAFGGANKAVGYGPSTIGNPDLKWETTTVYNAGLDFGFFNNRLTFVADYYYKKTEDLLWDISIPQTSGFGSVFMNAGKLENWGIELGANADILEGEFKWNTAINFSLNRNKLLDLGGAAPGYQGDNSGHLKVKGSWLEVGQPVGVWYMWEYAGVFQNQTQLDELPNNTAGNNKIGGPRFVDQDDDGDVDSNDRAFVGDPNPDFIYSINNNLSFKNFDLSIFVDAVQGNDVLNVHRGEYTVSGPWGNQRREILNRWTPNNTTSNIPAATRVPNATLLQSSWLIEDGSFVRLRNITLGYRIPITKYIRNARIYVSGQNLWVLTDYSGYSPDVNSRGNNNLNLGVDYNAYPASKMYLVGINLGL